MQLTKYMIEELGEESGREEASCDYPNIPAVSKLDIEKYRQWERSLKRDGLKRAQDIYELNGREAVIFAQCWAMGYLADCDLFEQEGMFGEEEKD
jgi:hypothetical protein